MEKLHEWVMSMTDEFTFNNTENYKGDEGRLPEHDVIEMTEEQYREIFLGPTPPKEPWYIAFIKKKRSQDHFWQSQYVVNMMRILADEYQGKVRFAYISAHAEEKLKEIFGVKTLPNQFLIEDGIVYEHNMLQVLYNNIYNFIEGGERRTNFTYDTFPVPRVITEFELKLKYVYNFVYSKWHH